MKINPRQNSARGFSLIELMVVILVIGRRALLPFVFASLIAYILAPVIRWIHSARFSVISGSAKVSGLTRNEYCRKSGKSRAKGSSTQSGLMVQTRFTAITTCHDA